MVDEQRFSITWIEVRRRSSWFRNNFRQLFVAALEARWSLWVARWCGNSVSSAQEHGLVAPRDATRNNLREFKVKPGNTWNGTALRVTSVTWPDLTWRLHNSCVIRRSKKSCSSAQLFYKRAWRAFWRMTPRAWPQSWNCRKLRSFACPGRVHRRQGIMNSSESFALMCARTTWGMSWSRWFQRASSRCSAPTLAADEDFASRPSALTPFTNGRRDLKSFCEGCLVSGVHLQAWPTVLSGLGGTTRRMTRWSRPSMKHFHSQALALLASARRMMASGSAHLNPVGMHSLSVFLPDL